jgi:hypothetical protein
MPIFTIQLEVVRLPSVCVYPHDWENASDQWDLAEAQASRPRRFAHHNF